MLCCSFPGWRLGGWSHRTGPGEEPGGGRKGVTGGNKVGHDQIWSTATVSNNLVEKIGQMNFESESKFGKYICRCLICIVNERESVP